MNRQYKILTEELKISTATITRLTQNISKLQIDKSQLIESYNLLKIDNDHLEQKLHNKLNENNLLLHNLEQMKMNDTISTMETIQDEKTLIYALNQEKSKNNQLNNKILQLKEQNKQLQLKISQAINIQSLHQKEHHKLHQIIKNLKLQMYQNKLKYNDKLIEMNHKNGELMQQIDFLGISPPEALVSQPEALAVHQARTRARTRQQQGQQQAKEAKKAKEATASSSSNVLLKQQYNELNEKYQDLIHKVTEQDQEINQMKYEKDILSFQTKKNQIEKDQLSINRYITNQFKTYQIEQQHELKKLQVQFDQYKFETKNKLHNFTHIYQPNDTQLHPNIIKDLQHDLNQTNDVLNKQHQAFNKKISSLDMKLSTTQEKKQQNIHDQSFVPLNHTMPVLDNNNSNKSYNINNVLSHSYTYTS